MADARSHLKARRAAAVVAALTVGSAVTGASVGMVAAAGTAAAVRRRISGPAVVAQSSLRCTCHPAPTS
jgi:F0F1-type ATP synthase membrane subunit c/vacuolar-type H+-ATPase subunit K